jgi:hypothetical protein
MGLSVDMDGDRANALSFRPLTVEGSLEDLEDGKVAMSINEPQLTGSGAYAIEGPVTIRGWAHARGGIEAVVVAVDGKRYTALRPVVRTDLLEYYGAEAAREGGFVLHLHATECPPGPHRLAVVAIGRDGDTVGVEGEIVCRPESCDDGVPPDPAPNVEWIEQRATPRENRNGSELSLAGLDPATPPSPEAIQRLYGLALMWESRALLAEADAAASRVEAGLASTQQEVTLRMLREAEAKLRSADARGS